MGGKKLYLLAHAMNCMKKDTFYLFKFDQMIQKITFPHLIIKLDYDKLVLMNTSAKQVERSFTKIY